MSGKSPMSCSANSSLCCTPVGMKVLGRGSRSRSSNGPAGKPWSLMKWRIELSTFHGEVDR